MYDIQAIQRMLPHSYPFLLVDRIVELEEGESARGLKNVTINEEFFQGHFPKDPVMPGVLILESMAQVAGLTLYNYEKTGDIPYLAGIDKARIRQPVRPGDQLIIDVKVLRARSKVAKVEAVAMVDEVTVAEAVMMFAIT